MVRSDLKAYDRRRARLSIRRCYACKGELTETDTRSPTCYPGAAWAL